MYNAKKCLFKWFISVKENINVLINGPILKEKGIKFIMSLGKSGFVCR